MKTVLVVSENLLAPLEARHKFIEALYDKCREVNVGCGFVETCPLGTQLPDMAKKYIQVIAFSAPRKGDIPVQTLYFVPEELQLEQLPVVSFVYFIALTNVNV